MNITNVMLGARKPRSDAIQFLLSVGLERCRIDNSEYVNLDFLVHDYMLFGPEHSARNPFPTEEDLASALVWLQRNGYLFLAGDDVVCLSKELGAKKIYSARLLCMAVEGALERLSATPKVQHPASL